MLYEPASSSRRTVKFMTAAAIGAALLFLYGLTLTGAIRAQIMATPILILFSSVLVPAGIVLFLVTTSFFFSGGCGLAAMMALSWMSNYVTGKYPPGADKLDYVRGKLAERAKDMKERAKEYGRYVKQKAQEATQTQTQA